ncbi:hypothetical protein MD484_g2729, partial [Candolleomyces efflorescens]
MTKPGLLSSGLDGHKEHEPIVDGGDKLEKGRDYLPRRRRYFRAVIWLLTFIALVHFFVKRGLPFFHDQVQQDQDDKIPEDVAFGQCANWTQSVLDDDHDFSTEFFIDTAAPLFLSKGTLSTGEIYVTRSKNLTASSQTKVNIAVKLDGPTSLEDVRVCKITKPRLDGPPGDGIGIFSSSRRSRQKAWFTVTVELPRIAGGEDPLNIFEFTSRMPSFVHAFRNVESVHFHSLVVSTSNHPVIAQSVFGSSIDIVTSEAPIRGSFNVTKSLTLATSNAGIDVNLGLHESSTSWTTHAGCGSVRQVPVPRWPQHAPVQATLRTRRGVIRASVNLSRMARSIGFKNKGNETIDEESSNAPTRRPRKAETLDTTTTGGIFSLSADNERGPIDIEFGEAPLNHTLRLSAATSFDDVKVTIPHTFEGHWLMKAMQSFREVVDTRESYTDPAGDSRDRGLCVIREGLFEQEGSVWWSGVQKVMEGSVDLRSKFGRVTLVV